MKTTDIIKRLHIEKKEFVISSDLNDYCKEAALNYDSTVKYLEERKYLVRIFRGIFYVKTAEELYSKHAKYNHLELVAKGLELKNVTNWYFGLYTALKINNMTHEYFTIDDVLNDSIFRQNPMSINGRKFNFIKISKKLLNIGIKKHGMINYSDPEKTILDFIYLWKYNGKQNKRIVMDISEWANNLSKIKLKKYSKHYPKSVQKIIDEVKL